MPAEREAGSFGAAGDRPRFLARCLLERESPAFPDVDLHGQVAAVGVVPADHPRRANDAAAVKAEFEKKIAEDPALAKDAGQRLDFFYRKHPSWDSRLNLYPVYRVDSAP